VVNRLELIMESKELGKFRIAYRLKQKEYTVTMHVIIDAIDMRDALNASDIILNNLVDERTDNVFDLVSTERFS